MEQYIPKSALVAEIERLENSYDYALDYEAALEDMRNFLNSVEVKEVDLEKEAERFVQTKEFIESTENPVILLAKHFFELGIKAQKGE